MRKILLPLAFVIATPPALAQDDPAPTAQPAPKVPKEIAKELASGDGKTQQTAIVIYEESEGTGIRKEYVILKHLGLKPLGQALVFDDKTGKPYDVLHVVDPKTGTESDVWFDISNYFGKF